MAQNINGLIKAAFKNGLVHFDPGQADVSWDDYSKSLVVQRKPAWHGRWLNYAFSIELNLPGVYAGVDKAIYAFVYDPNQVVNTMFAEVVKPANWWEVDWNPLTPWNEVRTTSGEVVVTKDGRKYFYTKVPRNAKVIKLWIDLTTVAGKDARLYSFGVMPYNQIKSLAAAGSAPPELSPNPMAAPEPAPQPQPSTTAHPSPQPTTQTSSGVGYIPPQPVHTQQPIQPSQQPVQPSQQAVQPPYPPAPPTAGAGDWMKNLTTFLPIIAIGGVALIFLLKKR